jgi:SAM-dependent methyltransferase
MMVRMSSVRKLMARVPREIAKTVRHPSRVLKLSDRKRRSALGQALTVDAEWTGDGAFRTRSYRSYDDYVRHQSAKVALKGDLSEYDARFRAALAERLHSHPDVRPGMSALCLAARIGTEVKAFGDAGCFAVGIDLNPADGDRYVLRGDFHALQFADDCVDVVFTNSLDHALDLERLLGEVRRVLKPAGLLLVEAMRGEEEGKNAGFYEAFHWERAEDLISRIEASGFKLSGRDAIDQPWPGQHLRFRSGADTRG